MKRFTALFIVITLALTLLASCAKEEATVKMLRIVKEPDRTAFEEGELFDPAGMQINAEMSDGTVQENVDYTVKKKDALTRSDNSVTFTYGGKTAILQITVEPHGNNDIYSVANTDTVADSPLAGKTYLWLGSSVTYGYGSKGESMVDFIAKKHNANCIKEAVSGTTLADIKADNKGDSYVKRLEDYIASPDKADHLDAFICQLSTNDAYDTSIFGTVTGTDTFNISAFDKATTFGAIEYIIALVRDTWDCPVVFYTNSKYNNAGYVEMVAALHEIEAKWGITVIDLFNDEELNDITEAERDLYMLDAVHPTRAGYRDWWLERFEAALTALN